MTAGRPTRPAQSVTLTLEFEDGTKRGVRYPITNIPDATRLGTLVGVTIVEQLNLAPGIVIPVVPDE